MSKLKVLSWNVEHFDGRGGLSTRGADRDEIIAARQDRLDRIVDYIHGESPDVFGLSEVKGQVVHSAMTSVMPDYAFHMTQGKQSQEILIGVKKTPDFTSFATNTEFDQQDDLKRNNPYLRPGALLTLTFNRNTHVPILFAHLKSASSPEGFGLRDAMLDKVFSLRNALNKAARKNGHDAANFIFLGDLNTMGMEYGIEQYDIPGVAEIEHMKANFRRREMVALEKSHDTTFSNRSGSQYPDSDLDHVFAAKHMLDQFERAADGSIVHVGGWAKLNTQQERDDWILKNSDHAPLIFTLNVE